MDPQNMYNRVFDFPEQMLDALKIVRGWKVSARDFPGVANIVVAGMGGSAIGGDLTRSYLANRLVMPMTVCRNYSLPEFVDDESLVIVSSYSGNTEETLSALNDALERKAMIAAITTGGMLSEIARLNEIPLATLPEGLQPRAALGYSFVPIVALLDKVGIVAGMTDEVSEAAESLKVFRESYIEDVPVDDNPAKYLASRIHQRIPIVYSGAGITETVAMRWKGQFCENSKNMAFANTFPEFNHNELVGYAEALKPLADRLVVVMLRDEDDHPKIKRRMEIVRGIIDELEIEVIDIDSAGEAPMTRMFSLIQLGDFASCYLAVLNGVDPTPVEAIEKLKAELAKDGPAEPQMESANENGD